MRLSPSAEVQYFVVGDLYQSYRQANTKQPHQNLQDVYQLLSKAKEDLQDECSTGPTIRCSQMPYSTQASVHVQPTQDSYVSILQEESLKIPKFNRLIHQQHLKEALQYLES